MLLSTHQREKEQVIIIALCKIINNLADDGEVICVLCNYLSLKSISTLPGIPFTNPWLEHCQ